MTDIKAFRAIKPGTSYAGLRLNDLKKILEPVYGSDAPLKSYRSHFKRLLREGELCMEEIPSLYIYENSSAMGIQKGIWALTDVNDNAISKIIQHEQTILEHEEKIRNYREQVGLEGEPILLTYHAQPVLDTLIAQVVNSQQPECYTQEETLHKFWKINDPALIKSFELAFTNIENLYIADGHHRLAAAVSMRHKTKQWISTLYIAADQIRIREFNRMIIPDQPITKKDLFDLLYTYFHISAIPNNIPYCPDHHHRIGLCVDGQWHQLNLKEDFEAMQAASDTVILQDYIFEPFFGITNPREDSRLKTYDPVKGWPELVRESRDNPSAIAFTLFPMTIHQLIEYADRQQHLPPKSTWIEPKVPYGILIYCAGLNAIR